MRFCGQCGSNIQQAGVAVLHPSLDDGTVLCGNTGHRAHTYASAAELPPPMRNLTDVAVDAKREFAVVMEALAYRAAHEDTPVEVNTDGGWMDMTELLEPLSKLLSDD